MKRTFALFAFVALFTLVANAQRKYSFRGKLGSSIMFRLDLEQNADGIVSGETTYYRKNGQIAKLRALGRYEAPTQQMIDNGYNKHSISLMEYDGTKQCGNFYIELEQGQVSGGTWSLLDKEYQINSIEKTQFPAGTKYFHPATGAGVTGTYSYSYSRGGNLDDCGGTCTLSYSAGKIRYSVSAVTPNIAETRGLATPKGSYFTGAHQDYRFKVYMDRDFICIWSTNSEYVEVDDWGAWATIAGTFIREKK